MGLLLSVLVFSVGVIEALSVYDRFRSGFLPLNYQKVRQHSQTVHDALFHLEGNLSRPSASSDQGTDDSATLRFDETELSVSCDESVTLQLASSNLDETFEPNSQYTNDSYDDFEDDNVSVTSDDTIILSAQNNSLDDNATHIENAVGMQKREENSLGISSVDNASKIPSFFESTSDSSILVSLDPNVLANSKAVDDRVPSCSRGFYRDSIEDSISLSENIHIQTNQSKLHRSVSEPIFEGKVITGRLQIYANSMSVDEGLNDSKKLNKQDGRSKKKVRFNLEPVQICFDKDEKTYDGNYAKPGIIKRASPGRSRKKKTELSEISQHNSLEESLRRELETLLSQQRESFITHSNNLTGNSDNENSCVTDSNIPDDSVKIGSCKEISSAREENDFLKDVAHNATEEVSLDEKRNEISACFKNLNECEGDRLQDYNSSVTLDMLTNFSNSEMSINQTEMNVYSSGAHSDYSKNSADSFSLSGNKLSENLNSSLLNEKLHSELNKNTLPILSTDNTSSKDKEIVADETVCERNEPSTVASKNLSNELVETVSNDAKELKHDNKKLKQQVDDITNNKEITNSVEVVANSGNLLAGNETRKCTTNDATTDNYKEKVDATDECYDVAIPNLVESKLSKSSLKETTNTNVDNSNHEKSAAISKNESKSDVDILKENNKVQNIYCKVKTELGSDIPETSQQMEDKKQTHSFLNEKIKSKLETDISSNDRAQSPQEKSLNQSKDKYSNLNVSEKREKPVPPKRGPSKSKRPLDRSKNTNKTKAVGSTKSRFKGELREASGTESEEDWGVEEVSDGVETESDNEAAQAKASTSEGRRRQRNQENTSADKAFWLIFSGEYTKAMSKDWHSSHFCCWQCDESLTGQRYVLREEHPYCIKCYESVFANSCEECSRIIGIDSKDLSYKDKHWHEACFLCSKCRVSLVDKQFGSKADKIYCGNCYDAQFASRCDGCGQIFRAGTKKMEYKTRQWHEQCFCCCVCKSPIGTKSFIPREQEIYCATCYEEKFATRCVKCNKIITSGGVTYKNEPWHRECFTCTNCGTSLAGQRFTSREDKPYCAECFGELFAKRCTACCKPITGIGGTRFISFEDRHWHNECFICAACKTSLVGRGFITDGEDIICPECAKQKLM